MDRPSTCSGVMWETVPTIRPSSVTDRVSISLVNSCKNSCSHFATPKSRIFSRRSSSTIKLSGFRSRWTTPCWWAALSASARLIAISKNWSRGKHQFRDRLSPHQLHGDEGDAAVLLHGEDGDDVGMVERGDGLRFLLEALAARGGGHLRRQDLQRNLPAELDVFGDVDLSHASGADLLQDPIVGEGPPDHREPSWRIS